MSTNDAYLEPARRQGNLRVRGDTLVDRVLLDAGRAVGVRTAGGEELAADGVVVAAGAIHSPAILLRSGLERRGIGANLCDHASVAVHVSIRAESRSEPGNPALSQLLRFSSGMADAAVNDLQLTTVTAAGPGDRRHGSIQVALMQVFSRGRVALRSHDATEDPDVRFDLLSDDRDRVRLRHGACRLLEIARHPAVADHVDGVLWEPGGTAVGGALDDVALDAWLDAGVGDYVHAAGTCRMGRPDDADAVVDPDGAVIGTEGLWVVDASVMPDLPRANTHLPTVMLAERLSERLARRT